MGPGARTGRTTSEGSAQLARDVQDVAPLLDEAFGLALRRVRALLATRSGIDAAVRVTGISGMDLHAFLETEASLDAVLWCSFEVASGATSGTAAPQPATTALVALEGRLLSLLMGRLFGEGDTEPSAWAARAATAVERSVGGRLCAELMNALAGAWTDGPAPRFVPVAVAPNRRIAANLDPRSAVLVTTIQVGEDPSLGRLQVALPAALLIAPPAPVPIEPPLRVRKPQFERLLPVEVDLVVELGRVSLPLGALQALAVGDEIPLGAISEAAGRIGGRTAFIGEPGTSGDLRSFRIVRRVESSSSSAEDDR
jgi:flagellar motor switch/type III secretory pathway protein FliN